nr:isoform 2 of mapk/mak/mrk overlapping kinase [Quercus suber]
MSTSSLDATSDTDGQELPADIQALPIQSFVDLAPLITCYTEEDDKDGNPIFLRSIFAYTTDDYVSYLGQSDSRVRDLTAKQIKESLKRLSDNDIYPEVPLSEIITFTGPVDDKVFLKRPKLSPEFLGPLAAPKLILQEVETLEVLAHHPHPNIIHYHGCVIRRERIVGLIFDLYDMTLKQTLDRNLIPQLDVENLMTQIRSAVHHLHSLGLAHNDLNPMNIMVHDDNKTLILIDFGSCSPFGTELITAGTFEWTDEDFSTSDMKNDDIGLSKIERWLYMKKEEQEKELRSCMTNL